MVSDHERNWGRVGVMRFGSVVSHGPDPPRNLCWYRNRGPIKGCEYAPEVLNPIPLKELLLCFQKPL